MVEEGFDDWPRIYYSKIKDYGVGDEISIDG